MTTACRLWWRNCTLQVDSEIIVIDRIEDQLVPIDANVLKIRELISSLELCHHKAERWIFNIIEAIGVGETTKGLGTRLPGQLHSSEIIWQNVCAALSAWCAGCPPAEVNLTIDSIPAVRFLNCLGARSPLKEWQVQRVIERIRDLINWPESLENPDTQYVWLILSGNEYELAYSTECPEHYKEHKDFWRTTALTIIHDTEDGEEADLSLALAIDLLYPCNWKFVENLQIVLEAIGGKLNQEKPFAACSRNLCLLPNRNRMEVVSNTLRFFCGDSELDQEVDKDLLVMLGKPTEVKKWLAASLDKTIRLHLNPTADLKAISKLDGPEWIKK